ncbi:hypothetical protein [Micromonospora costi]|uniref:Uncharacterized protein n=1 Tax=Micromonospora costi TaxID=1530042 RepID=A0A3B0ACI7_9ACTN|nr:hypothetical protein [Micromonospora costi]RKN58111.1 hypothetical protein D7193_05820 [Micromonospora costi]
MLGACQVGKAWAAVDGQGRFATVAVLDGVAASDPRWREAFANAANTLAHADGGHPVAGADFSAAHPWVAYTAEEGDAPRRLFQSLGLDYQPVPDAPVSAPPTSAPPASGVPKQVSGVPQQVSAPPQPVSGAPELVSDKPQLPWAVHTTPTSGQPASASASPVSAAPTSPATPLAETSASADDAGQPPIAQARPGAPFQDPFATPTRRIKPSEPRPRRTGLWVGAGVLVLVLLAGVVGAVVWAGSDGTETPPEAAPSPTLVSPALPTSPPQSPGIEPPKPGAWPTQWPRFHERDTVRTFTDLEGLTFPVKVPTNWQCTLAARAEGLVTYDCSTTDAGSKIGGELTVRDCPQPCNEQWQSAMRATEEAWGAQWIRSGQYSTYAEQIIDVNGESRHGLVVVAYFRSGEDGAINRQLVIRMTSPVKEAYQLRRFASYIRDVVVF